MQPCAKEGRFSPLLSSNSILTISRFVTTSQSPARCAMTSPTRSAPMSPPESPSTLTRRSVTMPAPGSVARSLARSARMLWSRCPSRATSRSATPGNHLNLLVLFSYISFSFRYEQQCRQVYKSVPRTTYENECKTEYTEVCETPRSGYGN